MSSRERSVLTGGARSTHHVEMSRCKRLFAGPHSASDGESLRESELYSIIHWNVSIRPWPSGSLSDLSSLDPRSDAVSCKHGPSECLGNMIILCAAKLYPDPKLHLGFANCLIDEYSHIPERDFVEDCALTHGVDFEKMNDCISEEGEGVDLLRRSIERSATNNVTRSCTVRLDGKFRCIRDGGEWYDCEDGSSVKDLVHDIDALYNKTQSRARSS